MRTNLPCQPSRSRCRCHDERVHEIAIKYPVSVQIEPGRAGYKDVSLPPAAEFVAQFAQSGFLYVIYRAASGSDSRLFGQGIHAQNDCISMDAQQVHEPTVLNTLAEEAR